MKKKDIRPSEGQYRAMIEDGWPWQVAKKGYDVFRFGRLDVVERIDSGNVFEGDLEAAAQASRDGAVVLLKDTITATEKQALIDEAALSGKFYRIGGDEVLFGAIVDTPANRKAMGLKPRRR